MDRRVKVWSSRIERWQLKPGDHIYAWRSSHANAFPHHGIYESHRKVIHFKAPSAESSSLTGAAGGAAVAATAATAKTAVATVIAGPLGGAITAAVLMGKAKAAASYPFCRECREAMCGGGVVWCCLDCFLEGDNLRLFAYSVPPWFYASGNIRVIANRARLTCTMVADDPPEEVLERANDLLACNGFGTYNALVNNCFDFAFYCKTEGSLVSPARAPILVADQQRDTPRYGPIDADLMVPGGQDGPTCMIM